MKEQTKNKLVVIGVGGLLAGCVGSIIYQAFSIIRIIPAFIDWAAMLWNDKKEEES